MSGSEVFGTRRMRVGKLERNETGGDVIAHLVPDIAVGSGGKRGGELVVYGVHVIYRGVPPPFLDDPFDVTVREAGHGA